MRTTIDLPEDLFRRAKAAAALRGSTMKTLIVRAIEREITIAPESEREPRRVQLPLVHLPKGQRLDLTGFDFDDLLA